MNKNYKKYIGPSDIIRNVNGLGDIIGKYFSKHIDYIAPNGKPIRIIAQEGIDDEQLLYSYEILEFYMTEMKSEKLDKIANRLADNNAKILIPVGADRTNAIPEEALVDQPLFSDEIAVPGGKWYMECDYKHRCAAFEEIFHEVHGLGIGSFFNRQGDDYLAQLIHNAMDNALPANEEDWTKKGLWGIKKTKDCYEWLIELRNEGSLDMEYVISVTDCYYGFWEAWTEKEGSFDGEYIAKTRNDVKKLDPVGYDMVRRLFPEYLPTMFRLHPSLKGDFYMTYNKELPYTSKTQYLSKVRLTGCNDVNIYGNKYDNTFMINSGKNYIDGNIGHNIVQFSGISEEYNIKIEYNNIIVEDKVSGRDAITNMKNIEILRFKDKDISTINPNYKFYTEKKDIINNVIGLGEIVEKYYAKHLDYIAPNGMPIKLIAHKNISDEQLIYAHDVMKFFISCFDEEDGSNPVADRMAENHTVYVLPNGADRTNAIPEEALIDQDLYEYEIATVGSTWYMENDYVHRDATFEEIFHSVHGMGIGARFNTQAKPELGERIFEAFRNAFPEDESKWTKEGLWGLREDQLDWLHELAREASLDFEYIVAVIDCYYGFWGAYKEDDFGMRGRYIAKTRDIIKEKDPMGYELVESFLPKYLTFMARLDPKLSGEFHMEFDEDKQYTHKSQYLRNVRALGKNDLDIYGNNQDNIFMVNSGLNHIDGKGGFDVVQFKGYSNEYDISAEREAVKVIDLVEKRDGESILNNIDVLRFLDKDIEI